MLTWLLHPLAAGQMRTRRDKKADDRKWPTTSITLFKSTDRFLRKIGESCFSIRDCHSITSAHMEIAACVDRSKQNSNKEIGHDEDEFCLCRAQPSASTVALKPHRLVGRTLAATVPCMECPIRILFVLSGFSSPNQELINVIPGQNCRPARTTTKLQRASV